MCVVSMVTSDFYRDEPWFEKYRSYPGKVVPLSTRPLVPVDREEFEELKRRFEELAERIDVAKAQDMADGNPDCEKEESIELLKAIAEKLGVGLNL